MRSFHWIHVVLLITVVLWFPQKIISEGIFPAFDTNEGTFESLEHSAISARQLNSRNHLRRNPNNKNRASNRHNPFSKRIHLASEIYMKIQDHQNKDVREFVSVKFEYPTILSKFDSISRKKYVGKAWKDKKRTNTDHLSIDELISCETEDLPFVKKIRTRKSVSGNQSTEFTVQLEIDHQFYLDSGQDIVFIEQWIDTVYGQVSQIFSVHQIDLMITDVLIWDIPDPYTGTNSSMKLESLGQFVQDNHSSMAVQLLTTSNIGARAHLGRLCVPYNHEDHSGPYSVCGGLSIQPIITDTFSYEAFICAHELGHIIGSPHTHACVWGPQQNKALDNCFPSEGGCSAMQPPPHYTSAMSYCHLGNNGINFNDGFGIEPGTLIYTLLQESSCGPSNCSPNTACDDGDPCTLNDTWTNQCNCLGELIDMNQNGLCDLQEACIMIVNTDTLTVLPNAVLAELSISSSGSTIVHQDLIYSSGSEIQLGTGFTIPANVAFEAFILGCGQTN